VSLWGERGLSLVNTDAGKQLLILMGRDAGLHELLFMALKT